MEAVIQQDINELVNSNPELVDSFSGKKVLITGATGMIGRYAVAFLMESSTRGSEPSKVIASVRNQDKGETLFEDYLEMENFSLLVSDVNDLRDIDGDVDFIIHAASPTQPDDFLERPADIIAANVFATRNLLEIARQKTARFCLLSTLEIYGKIEADSYPVSVTESDFGALDSLSLRSAYPESKRMAENMVVAYAKQYGVASSIIRLAPTISPVIEPGDERLFAQLVKAAAAGTEVAIFSDAADKRRSYTYIADAVTGILTALVRADEDNFVFNLANNDNVASVKELAESVLRVAGQDPSSLVVNSRDADQNTSSTTGLVLLDSSRLLELGWQPRYDLDSAIRKTLETFKSFS